MWDDRILVQIGARVTITGSVTEVDITGGKEDFPGVVNSLPDYVKDVMAGALGEVNREPVVMIVADGLLGSRQGL